MPLPSDREASGCVPTIGHRVIEFRTGKHACGDSSRDQYLAGGQQRGRMVITTDCEVADGAPRVGNRVIYLCTGKFVTVSTTGDQHTPRRQQRGGVALARRRQVAGRAPAVCGRIRRVRHGQSGYCHCLRPPQPAPCQNEEAWHVEQTRICGDCEHCSRYARKVCRARRWQAAASVDPPGDQHLARGKQRRCRAIAGVREISRSAPTVRYRVIKLARGDGNARTVIAAHCQYLAGWQQRSRVPIPRSGEAASGLPSIYGWIIDFAGVESDADEPVPSHSQHATGRKERARMGIANGRKAAGYTPAVLCWIIKFAAGQGLTASDPSRDQHPA